MNGRWVSAAALVAAFGLVGCSSASGGGTQSNSHPAVPTFGTPTRPTTTTPPIGTTPPKACTAVAAEADVDKIVGKALGGSTGQVVGIAQANIGRTARLDCYFGIPAGQGLSAAVLTIGISTYTDAPSAQARVTSTVDGARSGGATVSTTKVDGSPASVMVGQQNQSLAMSTGTRTVLVTVNTGVLPPGNDTKQLVALTQLGLAAHA